MAAFASEGPELSSRRYGIRMRHIPTGTTVAGELPAGSHSDREERQRRDELRRRLWKELETKVVGSK